MSNRQARREQRRQAGGARPRPSQRRQPGRAPSTGGGGGPGDFLSRPYLIGVAVLVVALAGILLFIAFGGEDGGDDAAALQEAHDNFPSELASGYAVGEDDAPVEITMYEDFRCPHCLDYTANDEPDIVDEYVTSGQVKLIFQNFPVLGPGSVAAAQGAECAANEDRFWDYQNEVFQMQARGDEINRESVIDTGVSLGLDREEFTACVDSDETRETVQDQDAEARSFGITGTPGFLINGVPLAGGRPSSFEGWQTVIEQELERVANEGDDAGDGADDGDSADGEDDAAAGQ